MISRHCRALTKPYPGIRAKVDDENVEITFWEIVPFDNEVKGKIGQISNCFYSNEFLVNCSNGRVLIRDWEASYDSWKPKVNMLLTSRKFTEQIKTIINRHELKNNKSQPVTPRILNIIDHIFEE